MGKAADISRRRFLQHGGVLALGGAVWLSGCRPTGGGSSSEEPALGAENSPSAGESTEKFRFLQSFDALDNGYWTAWQAGGQQAAAVLGMLYEQSVSNYDVSVQRAAFEDASVQGMDAVGMLATDEGASPSLIGLLTGSDILVVNADSNAPWSTPLDIGPNYVSFHAADFFLSAKQVATTLFEGMGGKGKVVHLEGVRGTTHDTERTNGFHAALKAFPDIELVGEQPANYNRVEAQPVMENFLNANPDIGGVMCNNDDMAIGVITALTERGSEALVAGIDGIEEMFDAIEDGRALCTWAQHPQYGAALQAVQLFDALNGWKPTVPERMIYRGTIVIDTPESAAAYKEIMLGDDIPFDFAKMSRTLHPDDWDAQNLLIPVRPNLLWERREDEKPSGYELPAEYAEAEDGGEFDRVQQMYRDHFKTDPLEEVKRLTSHGGVIIEDVA